MPLSVVVGASECCCVYRGNSFPVKDALQNISMCLVSDELRTHLATNYRLFSSFSPFLHIIKIIIRIINIIYYYFFFIFILPLSLHTIVTFKGSKERYSQKRKIFSRIGYRDDCFFRFWQKKKNVLVGRRRD